MHAYNWLIQKVYLSIYLINLMLSANLAKEEHHIRVYIHCCIHATHEHTLIRFANFTTAALQAETRGSCDKFRGANETIRRVSSFAKYVTRGPSFIGCVQRRELASRLSENSRIRLAYALEFSQDQKRFRLQWIWSRLMIVVNSTSSY